MNFGMRFIAVFVAGLICVCDTVPGQFVVYGDAQRDQWFNDATNAGGVATIQFNDLPTGTTITNQYSDLGVTFTGLNFTSGPFPTYHDEWGIRIFEGNHLYFDRPMQWIAADEIGTLRMDIYSGDQFLHSFQRSSLNDFVGGYSSVPFDHVFIYDPNDFLAIIDDLHFGPPIVVPGPGVVWVATFVFLIRRRGRN